MHERWAHTTYQSVKCKDCDFRARTSRGIQTHMTAVHIDVNKGNLITRSKSHCDCRKNGAQMQSLGEEGVLDMLPRYVEGPEDDTMLVGGVSEMQRSVEWYTDILNGAGCNLQQNSQEAGQLLCWALMEALISKETLCTHNLSGDSTVNNKCTPFPEIDSGIMDAIFHQVKYQFPTFPCWHDMYCKTVSFLINKLAHVRSCNITRNKEPFRWSNNASYFQCKICDFVSVLLARVQQHERKVHEQKGVPVPQSKPTCDCQNASEFPSLEDEGLENISPRYIEGPEENTMLIGGVSEIQRSVEWYTDILNETGCNLQQNSHEAGQLLCWALMKAIFSLETLETHNLMGWGYAKFNRDKLCVPLPKIDSEIMDVIFQQVKYQFPSFPCWHDRICKTVTYLSGQLLSIRDAVAKAVQSEKQAARAKRVPKKKSALSIRDAVAKEVQSEKQAARAKRVPKKKSALYQSVKNKPKCQCQDEEFATLEDEGLEDVSPRYIEGPEEDTMLIGGVSEMQRSVDWYADVLNEAGCNIQQNSQEAGQLLCWALMKQIWSRETMETHNVTGITSVNGQNVPFPKFDSGIMDAIFQQVKIQFPSFPCWHGKLCKTMKYIMDNLRHIRKVANSRKK